MNPLAEATRHKLMLGLFLPIQSGGWSPSTEPRSTDWSFDYNAALTRRCEEIGFDLVFGQAQWLGADGYGGKTNYRSESLDAFIVAAGLCAITKRIIVISTLHILYGPLHPLHVAKFGATLDHMAHGRWGLNVVTGFSPDEFTMFGMDAIEHDQRYRMAAEFTDAMEALWRANSDVTLQGTGWKMKDAFASPNPVNGRPIMVSAASSPAGLDYAGKYADLVFITSPAGAEIGAALTVLPEHNAKVKGFAAKHGRTVKTIINPLIICRETEKEARAVYDRIVASEDTVAVDKLFGRLQSANTDSWKGHARDQRVAGGNIQIVGNPQQVAERCMALQAAGCDGIQICFFDFAPELEFFAQRVLPLLEQAGLREPETGAPDRPTAEINPPVRGTDRLSA
ncbi:MAG: LLM class flavin-dependent oxidoreductase [Rhodospirillales bacterium]